MARERLGILLIILVCLILYACNTFTLDIIVEANSDKRDFGDSRTTISYQSSESIETTDYTQSSSYQAPIKAITINDCSMKVDCKANKMMV